MILRWLFIKSLKLTWIERETHRSEFRFDFIRNALRTSLINSQLPNIVCHTYVVFSIKCILLFDVDRTNVGLGVTNAMHAIPWIQSILEIIGALANGLRCIFFVKSKKDWRRRHYYDHNDTPHNDNDDNKKWRRTERMNECSEMKRKNGAYVLFLTRCARKVHCGCKWFFITFSFNVSRSVNSRITHAIFFVVSAPSL